MSTVHLLPGMPAPDRRIHALRVAAFYEKYLDGMKIIFGNLNPDITGVCGALLRRLCDAQRPQPRPKCLCGAPLRAEISQLRVHAEGDYSDALPSSLQHIAHRARHPT